MTSEHELVHFMNVGDNGEASVLRSYFQHHGIGVYVQGENHRSLLGMVGAYIELSIMVPKSQLEEARELLAEYNNGQEAVEPPETRGPHRDQFKDEEEQDDSLVTAADLKIAKRRAILGAMVIPFGGGHFSAGASTRGFVLAIVSILGIVKGATQPAFFALWALAIAMDLYGSRKLINER